MNLKIAHITKNERVETDQVKELSKILGEKWDKKYKEEAEAFYQKHKAYYEQVKNASK